jgi:hypothetical protein
MRIAYGAGAVAVASVMAVGLIQPDFTATADQQATDDPNAANQGLAQDASTGSQGNGNARTDQSSNGAQANVQVNHVTKYIHLKPGQTAPPGATVIQPGQPTPRIVAANNPAPPPTNHNPNPPAGNPAPKPPPPPPPPTPRPTVKTHQSGHP